MQPDTGEKVGLVSSIEDESSNLFVVLDSWCSLDSRGNIDHRRPGNADRLGDGSGGQPSRKAEIQSVKPVGQRGPIADGAVAGAGIDEGQGAVSVECLNPGPVNAFYGDRDSPNYPWPERAQPCIGFGSMQLDPVEVQAVADIEDPVQRHISEDTDGCGAPELPDPQALCGFEGPRGIFDEDETHEVSAGLNGGVGVSRITNATDLDQHGTSVPWSLCNVKSFHFPLFGLDSVAYDDVDP